MAELLTSAGSQSPGRRDCGRAPVAARGPRQPGVSRLPKRIHLVGIGGTGLSAIARVLALRGHDVSGSDLRASRATRKLRGLGVKVYVGHSADQIGDAELVVISSAIPEANAEVRAARLAGISVLKRKEFFGPLLDGYDVVAVAGTHGKSTTSAMISVILAEAGLEPSFIVGGVIAQRCTNAEAGRGRDFVIEADEYDRAFHGLAPQVAVVTNIEMDHPDCFKDMNEIGDAFEGFLRRVRPGGAIVACADSPHAMRAIEAASLENVRVATYGRSERSDYSVTDISSLAGAGVTFVVRHRDERWGTFDLRLPGVHNALNGTAAALAAEVCGVGTRTSAAALAGFRGVLRRFEVKGEVAGVTVVDDYAHHPTEIRATLAAARSRYPGRALWVVLQPHTYSRVQALLNEFGGSFGDADHVIVTDIFAARARESETVHSKDLVAVIDHPDARHIDTIEATAGHLLERLHPGDVLLTLGAGDGYEIGERVLAGLEERDPS